MKVIEKPEYKDLVTFVPNKKEPVYNWLYYKEGFSRKLALELLDYFEGPILDPFCGVGTTLLASQEKGMESIGVDALPIAVFASRVKTRNYGKKDLEEAKKVLEKTLEEAEPEKDRDYSDTVGKAFEKPVLKKIIGYRNQLMEEEDRKTREFLLLGLINASLKSSYLWKDGSALKIKKRSVPPIEKSFRRQVEKMIQHAEEMDKEEVETKVLKGDARNLSIEENSVNGVLTSPPYLNKIEYTKVYKIEQEIFFNQKNSDLVRSFFGIDEEPERDEQILDLLEENPPLEALAYFNDMKKVLKELERVCKPGSKLAIVIGGGCFPTEVIQSDEVLAKLANELGFETPEVWITRHVNCMRNRTEKVGETRESIVWLRKRS